MEKPAKFKFTASNKSSIDIKIIKIFFRFKAIPIRPIKKTRLFSFSMKFILTVAAIILLGVLGFEPKTCGLKVQRSAD